MDLSQKKRKGLIIYGFEFTKVIKGTETDNGVWTRYGFDVSKEIHRGRKTMGIEQTMD